MLLWKIQKMGRAVILLLFLLTVAAAQLPLPLPDNGGGDGGTTPPPTPPPPPTASSLTLDTSELTSALNTNVQAIGNLSASNEKVVDKLQGTVDKMVDSNDKNVAQIVQAADRLIAEWDSSMQPTINDLSKVGKDALARWDSSLKPSVDNINLAARDALDAWDSSLKPRVDDGLQKFDSTLKVVNTTLGMLDDVISYTKIAVPLFLAFGSLWAGLCFISACMCLFAVSRKGTNKLKRKKQGYEEIENNPADEEQLLKQQQLQKKSMFQNIKFGRLRH